jgi:hypothetical protein
MYITQHHTKYITHHHIMFRSHYITYHELNDYMMNFEIGFEEIFLQKLSVIGKKFH